MFLFHMWEFSALGFHWKWSTYIHFPDGFPTLHYWELALKTSLGKEKHLCEGRKPPLQSFPRTFQSGDWKEQAVSLGHGKLWNKYSAPALLIKFT